MTEANILNFPASCLGMTVLIALPPIVLHGVDNEFQVVFVSLRHGNRGLSFESHPLVIKLIEFTSLDRQGWYC